jgi:hypothetical protein
MGILFGTIRKYAAGASFPPTKIDQTFLCFGLEEIPGLFYDQ